MVLKDQRRELNYFFIASTVYYIFILVLCLCLIPVAVAMNMIANVITDHEDIPAVKLRDSLIFMIFFSILGAVSLLYLVRRILWLLNEKDDELRYRSMKVGEEVLKADGGASVPPKMVESREGSFAVGAPVPISSNPN